MKAIALTVALALCPRWMTLAAQGSGVVYGIVTDTAGRGIEGAAVAITGTGLSAVVDGAGRYRLTQVPSGRTALRARRIGYEPGATFVDVPLGDSVRADFVLRAHPAMMVPTVVTAAKRSQLLDQAITSVAVVTDTQLGRRAVNTVDDAVDKAPGVQFLNGQVNIRGSTGYVQGLGSRVLLLVDGVPANQGDRGGISWDLVPLDEIERVEVVKGAGSSLYGSSAFGGVVNLIRRDVRPGFHARVRATGGAYAGPPHDVWRFRDYTGAHGGADVTASYGGATVRGSVTAGGRHSDGYREQDRRDHWETAGKAAWLPSAATRLTASGAWGSDQYETPLIWCTTGTCEDRGLAHQPFKIDRSGRGAFTRSDKGYLAAILERAPSERLMWQARGSWVRTHFVDHHPSNDDAPGNDDAAVSNRFGAEVRGTLRAPSEGGAVVTIGAEGARSDVRSEVASDIFGNHAQNEIAAYGESEQRRGRARITAGARIDFLVVDGGAPTAVVSPRAGIVLPSGPHVVWRASGGRGFRAPSLAERFVSTVVQGLTVIPNPALDPETAWSFELGAAAQVFSTVRPDAALFWTEAYDLIEPSVDLDSARIQFKNVTRARLVGLDLSLAARPLTPRLSTTLAYTFLYAREIAHDTVPERPLAFRPKHLLTLSADYQWGAVSAGADFRYTSRFERVELYVDDPRVAEQVLNLRAGYDAGSLSARCLVTNALNYIYNQVPRTLAPVRTLSLVLTWTY